MTLSEFVKETFEVNHGFCFRPRIVCQDGFSMSVQGNIGAYCSPRETVDSYQEMEIGFPSEDEMLIYDYAEQSGDLTNTVYPYVPCEIIQKVIDKHRGIDVEKTFNKSES